MCTHTHTHTYTHTRWFSPTHERQFAFRQLSWQQIQTGDFLLWSIRLCVCVCVCGNLFGYICLQRCCTYSNGCLVNRSCCDVLLELLPCHMVCCAAVVVVVMSPDNKPGDRDYSECCAGQSLQYKSTHLLPYSKLPWHTHTHTHTLRTHSCRNKYQIYI